MRRLATATATASHLRWSSPACGSSQTRAAPQSTSAAAVSAAAETAAARELPASGVDLSGVTLRIGETGWKQQELLLENAGLGRHPVQDRVQPVPGRESATRGARRRRDRPGQRQRDPADLRRAVRRARLAEHHRGPARAPPSPRRSWCRRAAPSPTSRGSRARRSPTCRTPRRTTSCYKALEAAGLTWTDIEAVPLSTSDGLAALLANQVDALASYGNAIIAAHANGATHPGRRQGHPVRQLRLRLRARTSSRIRPRRPRSPTSSPALQQGFNWARANPDAWAAVIAEQTKQPVEQALKTFVDGEAQRPSKFVPTSPEAIASQQDVLDTFVEAGILKTELRHRRPSGPTTSTRT